MNEAAKQFIDHRRSSGLSDQQIHQELTGAGWDSIAAHQVINAHDHSETPLAKPQHSTADFFLYAGVSLIIAAAIVFVSFSWSALTPMARFLAILLPNILLLVVAAALGHEQLRKVKHSLEATGLLMLPATVGVFLYQFGFLGAVDGVLLVWSGLAALLVYLFVALGARRDYGWLLIGFASVMIMIGFFEAENYGFGPFAEGISALVLGCLNLLTVASFKRRGVMEYSGLAESIATVLLIIGLPLTIIEGLIGLGLDESSVPLLSGLGGMLGLLFFAGLFGKLANIGPSESFQQRLVIIFALAQMFGQLL